MQSLSHIIALFFLTTYLLLGQSPHGDNLRIDCAKCHSPESWNFDQKNNNFNHDSTEFELRGQHQQLDCKSCHSSLKFDAVSSDCKSCHTDIHQTTVGNDCRRCHHTDSWLVTNISEIHEQANFPLTGVHTKVDCRSCHSSETNLRFNVAGVQCIDCHRADYESTTKPNHKKSGFSQNCAECHDLEGNGWNTDRINHDFFPLNKGHDIQDCARCHTTSDYSNISKDCISCHRADYDATQNPPHKSAGFPNTCVNCHTTDPNWTPAQFVAHDLTFPIYSGKHKDKWTACVDCHKDQNDFSKFTCISCHLNPETDDSHKNVVGYRYRDDACLACHPKGDADMAFDHNATAFPLTGAHLTVDCAKCHTNGYKGTPSNCVDCHQMDFDGSQNPNHKKIGLSTDCIQCHTTTPNWTPAKFDIHDQYYELKGAHKQIASDCIKCHQGDFNNTPNTCVGCHQDDYDKTIDPNHKLAQFPTDCASCHSESSWVPSQFNHDGMYFPIYSGKHKDKWTQCVDCHANPSNYAEFRCTNCHINPETDQLHTTVQGYTYQDRACFACHPTGDADVKFDHNNTAFPLTGAHTAVNCLECHTKSFQGTSTVCVDCHQSDFDGSQNPNHKRIGLSTDCIQCHTTTPDWSPAKFDIHNQFYELKGAHAQIAQDCKACHNGDYNNTPNTCVGCHQSDYNNTKDPEHSKVGFTTDCASCHSESSWVPSTFNHDGMYFPIYSGKHKGTWSQCIECHDNPNDYSQFTCISCHKNPETDTKHTGVQGYIYQSNACLACHPTGDAAVKFDHNMTAFPLTGVHTTVNCLECHSKGFKGTSTICVDCHRADYDQSQNPNHNRIALSTDCASCHTTMANWEPARFDIHNNFYVIEGAHTAIAQDCKQCHNGNYNNTPNTCVGCHQSDFDAAKDPDHIAAKFTTDCRTCHSQSSWTPSTFNHDGMYFPIYSGKHKGVWNQCNECHQVPNDYTQFTCITCHMNPTTDDQHKMVGGYQYQSNACLACHPSGDASMPFDHNATAFPLTGAHTAVNCAECHTKMYKGTSTICVDCHQKNFDESINPNHKTLGLSNDCIQCHTTAPDWTPAKFDIHNQFYELKGAHIQIAQDCKACHKGNYNNTPNTCVGCHQMDYDETKSPNHKVAQFPTDCASCHAESSWTPATFNHDGMYFPIYSGTHKAKWSQCIECHNDPNDFSKFTCISCHVNPETNTQHQGVGGYIYADYACLACHPTGEKAMAFDHNLSMFPLTGAHTTVDCRECHKTTFKNTPKECNQCHQTDYNTSRNPSHTRLNLSTDCASCHTTAPGWAPARFDVHNNYYVLDGAHLPIAADCAKCHHGNYNNTPSTCVGCHQADYNASTNPNHRALNIPTNCVNCHTTTPDWKPATFDIHDNYYQLIGAHATIRDNCAACHNGNYNNTPNTCVGCHQQDYNQTTNPNHSSAQFPTNCVQCHSQSSWKPATFNHDGMYFPIYSGKHDNEWNSCSQCHTNPNNYSVFSCFACHPKNRTDNDHNGVNGYQYLSSACYSCHPDGKE